jgi:SAM-dependent methyltransferase
MAFRKVPRRLIKWASSVPGVRQASIIATDLRWRLWKRRHPNGSYGEFYSTTIAGRIERGGHHPTLGKRGWKGGGPAVEWESGSFATRGRLIWQQLLDWDLKPDMRCVDYGCGSLRIGQHAIRFLEPGNYFGIDVTDDFIKPGIELLGPELMADKRPRLGVIDAGTLADIRRWEPDFIFSNAVIQHVPPQELSTFFARLEAMMASRTRAFIIFPPGEKLRRVKSMSWDYPDAYLLEALKRASPRLGATIGEVDPRYEADFRGPRSVLQITAKA